MGHMNIVIYLIQNNANPDFTTVRGETALHLAARANQTDIIRILLRNGATVDARARVSSRGRGITLTKYFLLKMLIILCWSCFIISLIHLEFDSDPYFEFIWLRYFPIFRSQEQQTPLHIAARLGNVDNVTLLLQLGAAPDAVTKDLYTPLHIAAKEGHEEVAAVLLEHGASHGLTTKVIYFSFVPISTFRYNVNSWLDMDKYMC